MNIVECCHKLYARGLVGGTEGNVSRRQAHDQVWITPANMNKSQVQPTDLVVLYDGKVCGTGVPSSEYKLHLEIYKRCPGVGAICHAHPIYATAFAKMGESLLCPELIAGNRLIPISMPYPAGSLELASHISEMIIDYDAVLIKDHGVVTVGDTLDVAFDLMEMVERLAMTTFLKRLL